MTHFSPIHAPLNLDRIVILGPTGAGKTTLTNSIASALKLPAIHLDREFWLPGYTKPAKLDWEEKVRHLSQHERWIMDGNYLDTIDCRILRADLIVMLALPQSICVQRYVSRSIKNYGTCRPDLGLVERINAKSIVNACSYMRRHGERFRAALRSAERLSVRTITLSSPKQVARFIQRVAVKSDRTNLCAEN